jgi:arylsulfatase
VAVPLTRRALAWFALALPLALLAAGCKLPVQRGRWNVVFVVVDTLRADRLSAYGYGRPTSPRFDAFAKGGYLFTDARAQASCTYPSVNSLLTSRYPARFLDQPGGALGIPSGVRSLPEILAAHGWSTGAVSASAVVRATPSDTNPSGGFGRGFGQFDEECTWRDATCVTQRGLDEVGRLREPFLLYLHYLDPHGPYKPPQPFRRRFRIGTSDQVWAVKGNPNLLTAWLEGKGKKVDYTPADVGFMSGLYDGEVAFWDDRFGLLLDELQQRGLLDRTVVVVVADHGEAFLEHGSLKHCRTVYDEEVKTPLLLRLPRQRGGERLAGAVQNLDVMPTLLDLLGLPLAPQQLEGVSLLPRLDGRGPGGELAFSMINNQRSVSDGRYKLVRDFARNSWALFDLARDAGERHDIARQRPAELERLRAALEKMLARTEGPGADERSREATARLHALGYL